MILWWTSASLTPHQATVGFLSELNLFSFTNEWRQTPSKSNSNHLPLADNNTETIPATLGRRNVKLSQTKAISLDHPFLGSQRSKTKHSFYYLQGKKGEKEKKGEGEMYKVKKKKRKQKQTDCWLHVKANTASSACLLARFGAFWAAAQSPQAWWNIEEITAYWQSTYHRAVTRFTSCFDLTRKD